jgi:ergosteryl-3beta-O-L-aspartate synthase
MSSLRKTLSKVKHVLKDSAMEITSPIAHHDKHSKTNGHRDGEESKGERRTRIKREQREEMEARNNDEEEEIRLRRIKSDELAEEQEPKELRMRYGETDLVGGYDQKIVEFKSGEDVGFRARVHTIRKMSSKLAFIVFRQQIATIQGVIQECDHVISTHMVRWAERIPIESIVLVSGKVRHPIEKVTGTSIKDLEIMIEELHVLSPPSKHLPFTIYQAEEESLNRDPEDRINDRQRLSNRLLEIRTPTTQSIFRINAVICNIFRTILNDQDFIEIHTPKLQAGATESGSSVFEVNYFNRPAYLAQSPQLMKQMSLAADLDRVYEIGPVFRAENSNTHRHLTEYVGLDLEMTLRNSYYEAMDVIDEMLKAVFKGVYENHRVELEIIKRRFPHEDLVWLDKTLRIPFADAIQLLVDSGWTQDGKPPSANEDLSTPAEVRLGELVKQKYHTDYYILDKFPSSARPFYTMLDAENPKVSNSFDIFLRGQEIVTGGQRIHDAEELEDRMKELGVPAAGMEEYLQGFEYGAPPHAGCGIGLEQRCAGEVQSGLGPILILKT